MPCACSRPRPVNVIVHHYPFEASNNDLRSFMEAYGAVKNVRMQHYADMNDVSTGSRIVQMIRQKVIPRSVTINGYSCKVWYPGQPLTCDVCREEGHIARNCPFRDVCRNCHLPGHFSGTVPIPRELGMCLTLILGRVLLLTPLLRRLWCSRRYARFPPPAVVGVVPASIHSVPDIQPDSSDSEDEGSVDLFQSQSVLQLY